MIKRLLILIIYACAMIQVLPAVTQGEQPAAPAPTKGGNFLINEKLAYNVYFHMGFIWAKAGYGELSFQKQGNGNKYFHGHLAAKSLSIVEHIMKVRDTLDCWFNEGMVPTEFQKGTHEGSYNSITHNLYYPCWHQKGIAYNLSNVDSTKVVITRWRKKGKDAATYNVFDYTNQGAAYDMLSTFFSICNLDYPKMETGKKLALICYDAGEFLTVKCEFLGSETCKLRSGKEFDSFVVNLQFYTKGQKDTPLKVWLSKEPDHHPVKAVIGLKRIGSVQCEILE